MYWITGKELRQATGDLRDICHLKRTLAWMRTSNSPLIDRMKSAGNGKEFGDEDTPSTWIPAGPMENELGRLLRDFRSEGKQKDAGRSLDPTRVLRTERDRERWNICARRCLPILTCQKLSLSVRSFIHSFEFVWRHIVAMAMNSFRIVESFQIFKNQLVCLLIVANFKAIEPFTFDNRMKAFNACIIPRKSFLRITALHIFGCFLYSFATYWLPRSEWIING